jgi:acetyl esterase/lipase
MPYYKSNNIVEYEDDNWGSKCVFNVVKPQIYIFKAKGVNSSKAVLILPGGGYGVEAIYHEGFDVAEKLAASGITAVVLKYRLPLKEASDTPELLPITDVRQSLSLIRSMADSIGVDKNSIGVMGFSAGSHLATNASVNLHENKDYNPNFSLLIYGVSRLNENIEWLESDLFKRKMTEQELDHYNYLKNVNQHTVPAFLVHSIDDEVCHYSESTLYAEALIENKVEVEMHLFPKGGHGFGLGDAKSGTDQWIELANSWIKRQ